MLLRNRLLSAIILIPVVFAAVYFGGLFYFVVFATALVLAGWEFCAMAHRAGHEPQLFFGLALIALFALNAYAHLNAARDIVVAILALSLIAAIFRHGAGWLVGWALTLTGALYIGGLGSYIIALRELPNGLPWTVLALFSTWATDTFAFMVGTAFGRRPFFQHISPKKTWEGALGGLGGAIFAAWLFGTLYGLAPLAGALFGLGVGIAGTLGDLAESLVKRQLGAKDSGVIVPGHGGALDRLDSLLFAFAFAYYYVQLFSLTLPTR
jgi:phosphatidate cytidylyltransferase